MTKNVSSYNSRTKTLPFFPMSVQPFHEQSTSGQKPPQAKQLLPAAVSVCTPRAPFSASLHQCHHPCSSFLMLIWHRTEPCPISLYTNFKIINKLLSATWMCTSWPSFFRAKFSRVIYWWLSFAQE